MGPQNPFLCEILGHYLLKHDYRGADKTLKFLADMSAKTLSPPPLCLHGHISKNFSFSCIKVYDLKRERPETDDFEIKKNLVVKEKYEK